MSQNWSPPNFVFLFSCTISNFCLEFCNSFLISLTAPGLTPPPSIFHLSVGSDHVTLFQLLPFLFRMLFHILIMPSKICFCLPCQAPHLPSCTPHLHLPAMFFFHHCWQAAFILISVLLLITFFVWSTCFFILDVSNTVLSFILNLNVIPSRKAFLCSPPN